MTYSTRRLTAALAGLGGRAIVGALLAGWAVVTVYGYARVSRAEQTLDAQIDALVAAGVERERILADTISGARASRPGLDDLLARLQPGDVVVVWKLDRLGRSTAHLEPFSEVGGSPGAGVQRGGG